MAVVGSVTRGLGGHRPYLVSIGIASNILVSRADIRTKVPTASPDSQPLTRCMDRCDFCQFSERAPTGYLDRLLGSQGWLENVFEWGWIEDMGPLQGLQL